MPPSPSLNPNDYTHSPIHHAIILRNHTLLSHHLSSLPTLSPPTNSLSLSHSLTQESLSTHLSSHLDRRDVPFNDTPLHLSVRLNDPVSTQLLCHAGADVSLQNSSGWNPLQEALCLRLTEVSRILVKYHHLSAWHKWRRRLPRVVHGLRNMRDFYLEMSFHFESSIVPFIAKVAPSDTYRIWKQDGNLRADTSLAGFDGMKIQRADQSFLFLGDGDFEHDIPEGSLLVLNRDDKKIFDAFENAGAPMSEEDISAFCSQTSVYRPGMDVTKAELITRTNWRKQEKIENVGEWKAKVYDVNNVVFSFRSRKVSEEGGGSGSGRREEQVLPLELDEEDGFFVAENPVEFGLGEERGGGGGGRRHSSFVREHRVVEREREWVSVGRKSVDINFAPASVSGSSGGSRNYSMDPPRESSAGRKSVDFSLPPVPERRRASSVTASSMARVSAPMAALPPTTKEKEYVKSLKPTVWLTEQFPLKTEELLPLLDILANKVKAVRRMRELLTTKFPPGSFPVKIAIPVVPTVRVIITFTKFVPLQPKELFYTPLSSPRFLSNGDTPPEEQTESRFKSWSSSSSASAWLRRSNSSRSNKPQQQQCPEALVSDPFAIPSGYTWESIDSKNRKGKKSKSVRKSK